MADQPIPKLSGDCCNNNSAHSIWPASTTAAGGKETKQQAGETRPDQEVHSMEAQIETFPQPNSQPLYLDEKTGELICTGPGRCSVDQLLDFAAEALAKHVRWDKLPVESVTEPSPTVQEVVKALNEVKQAERGPKTKYNKPYQVGEIGPNGKIISPEAYRHCKAQLAISLLFECMKVFPEMCDQGCKEKLSDLLHEYYQAYHPHAWEILKGADKV